MSAIPSSFVILRAYTGTTNFVHSLRKFVIMAGGDAVPKFSRGDLVWAKMKGFSPWPGLVTIFSSLLKKPAKKSDTHCIFFFGTRNYAYVEEGNIMPYEEYKNKLVNSCKSASFKEAINEIERFIKKTIDDPNFDAAKFDPSEDFDDLFDCIRDSEGKSTPKNKKVSTGAGTKRASSNTPKSASKKRKSAEEKDSSLSPLPLANHISKKNYEELLNRPLVDRPRSPQLDISNVSENLKSKHIEASTKTFGFIGLGLMGSGIVKNLINSGHKINLWNRSIRKAEEVKSQADLTQPGQVKVWSVPCDVVYNSDIIFCCVSDPRAAKNIVYANCGVLYQAEGGCALEGKGYVELTSIDTETSKDLSNVITGKGGRYLEAQLQGSKEEADNGSLIVLGAGDKTLFDDCQSCFQAMGKTAFYLGEVGYASKMNLILQVMRGVALAGLAEGFVLADRSGLSLKDVMEIFSITSMSSPALLEKAKIIIDQDFRNPRMPLQHMQKDLKLALELSDSLQQPMLLASTANEIYKHARRLGYDKHDSAVVYMRARH